MVDSYADIGGSPVHPGRLAAEVARWLPEDAIISIDGGDTGLWAHLAFTHRQQRSLLWTGHYGHLGTGLPYAIGAKLANPERPSVLFTGDGAFGFNLQELETAASVGANVVVVINCDQRLGHGGPAHAQERGHDHRRATLRGPLRPRGRRPWAATVSSWTPRRHRQVHCSGPANVDSRRSSRYRWTPTENENPPGLDDFSAMYGAENT